MRKIQHLSLDFSSSKDFQQPFYCPFSGEMLVLSDPYIEFDDFPKTVIAVLTEHGSYFVREDFDESDFEDFEDFDEMEDLYSTLEKKVSKESGVLIVELGYYGNHPGDFGALIFILEIPYAFIK
jgi:hypothetical protein